LLTPNNATDHWVNTLGGDWATATNWNQGLPTATIDANVDATGTYSVAITSNAIADALLLNDAQATVTDNNGSLSLAGAGGLANPNGALIINAGTFRLNGGGLKAGAIFIGTGGTFLRSKGSYTGSNALSETINDNGSLIDNTRRRSPETSAEQARVSQNVTFASGSAGTFKLDHSLTAPFSLDSLVTRDLRSKFGLDNAPVTTGVQDPGGASPHLPPSREHVVALFKFVAAGLPGQNSISATTPPQIVATEQQRPSPTTDEPLHSLRLTVNLTRVAAGPVGFACSGQCVGPQRKIHVGAAALPLAWQSRSQEDARGHSTRRRVPAADGGCACRRALARDDAAAMNVLSLSVPTSRRPTARLGHLKTAPAPLGLTGKHHHGAALVLQLATTTLHDLLSKIDNRPYFRQVR